jgi:DNA replication protein DnaC
MRLANIPEALHNPIPLDCGERDLRSFRHLADIKDHIDEFIENGDNLYICSHNTGNGKTSWALKLAYKYFAYVWDICDIDAPQALFVYIPEFILALKDFNNPLSKKYLEHIKNVPLVIFDDIGTGEISNYDYTQLLVYVNARQLNKKSTIYTSNLVTLAELSSKIGDKLASRIYNSSEVVELKGKDMR